MRALQRTIFVGCAQLGLDNEARKALQLQVCGKSSMTDMTDDEMKAVIDRLRADGFNPKGKRKHPPAPRSDLRLVHVLWKALQDAGELDRPSREGLNAFIRKRFEDAWGTVPADIDMLRDADKIEAVIAALKAWMKRKSVPFDWARISR
ncbi:regulatory protein GemA [uncultured Tateyamaria sp.]|uniref:gp16 family protein n=1 Tax=uncultured Tateyamaria sp. TaxID=455651 RepID=UPI0026322E2A|nr:regulatory protein GemA [uncultured Tateyamaria sp.]